jgi:hypothetical protein
MIIMKNSPFFIVLFAFCYFQCKPHFEGQTSKMLPSDPFATTMVKSEWFEIDATVGHVIEGKGGTKIVFPIGSILLRNRRMYSGKAKIELAEALKRDDMLLSNLTTTSDGKPLITDGMIFFNVTTQDGEQLFINPEKPIFIEIPTEDRQPDMSAYRGTRDANGNMNWIAPKPIPTYLMTEDLASLDFLPAGFREEVTRHIPITQLSDTLVDSLYYSLSNPAIAEVLENFIKTDIDEAYNSNRQVKDGKYLDESIGHSDAHSAAFEPAIDPAVIKTIRTPVFQNTLIATRAFQKRLQTIYQTCDNTVLEIYINNLQKNLFELDSMAAQKVASTNLKTVFEQFTSEKLTNVQNAPESAKLLCEHYKQEVKRIKSELEQNKKQLLTEIKKQSDSTKVFVERYKQTLQKREQQRMETYGFEWTETGWVNIDNGTKEKDWYEQPIEIVVGNGDQYQQINTYVHFGTIKNICRLGSSNKTNFYVGNQPGKSMPMPKAATATALSIAWLGDQPALGVRTFNTGENKKMSLTLSPVTTDQLHNTLTNYETGISENSIIEDVRQNALLQAQEQRQDSLRANVKLIQSLMPLAFPCRSVSQR